MTNGVLSDDVIIGGKIYPDLRTFHTSDINAAMGANSSNVGRTVFYAQWALAEAGFYTGPINGVVGSTDAVFKAFQDLYDSQYSGGSYTRPANKAVTFAFFRDVIKDQSSVDPSVYKVVD